VLLYRYYKKHERRKERRPEDRR